MAENKPVIRRMTDATRSGCWRFFGALVMETKNGKQAVSLHRLLGLVTYCVCITLWVAAPERPMPSEMTYTLWMLLGINGAAKMAAVLRGGRNVPTTE